VRKGLTYNKCAMSDLQHFTRRLEGGEHLDEASAVLAAELLARGADEVDDTTKRAFLLALHAKGEQAHEVAAFARFFRSVALDPGLDDWAARGIDIVGTGGSGSSGYNVSSVSAMIVAACGVPVLKHGNRAVTSQSGSADFLGAAGLHIQSDPAVLRRSLEELNFCFFFAPAFHPAFREIVPVRKAMAADGKRSVFNILGPLINPAKPAFQLLGVMHSAWVAPLAEVLGAVGVRRGLVACSRLDERLCMDELTTAGENITAGVGELAALAPLPPLPDLGLAPCSVAELRGGTADENVALLRLLMRGDGPQGLADTIVLNAGAALHIAGAAADWKSGIAAARDCLLGGALAAWWDKARAFHAEVAG